MSKPFIVASRKGLKALPHWLKEQSFDGYSLSLSAMPLMINIGVGSGRQYTRTQGVLVKDEDLLEQAESIIRQHLGWQQKA